MSTHPKYSGVVVHASPGCGFVNSKIFDLRSTEDNVLIWFLNGRNELGWGLP
ncbi:hypothetical protein SERLA73DRAFT_142922 [Serpula lacrymans var. lacrymans S7.3]|uniref:Uncharacterized protein n=1 Tax=Serpula lacrymans var. lacrymans (strain S7.3) TaxID=936435 RepID=F8Q8M4_SERL3|nr:hypothetical protein SERLA73DRAFT_142922 [Serpula lacrymans var. lacrymans S7.3]